MALSPQLTFAISQVFYFLALVVRPSPYRFLFIVPIVLATIYYFKFALKYHTASEYTITCTMIAQLFQASNHILLTDVQRELFLKDQKLPAFHLPFMERVGWAARLYTNWRGVGWIHEPTHALPPHPAIASTSRFRYAIQETGKLILEALLYDAAATYANGHPSFMRSGYSIAQDGFLRCIVNVLVIAIIIGISIDMPHRSLGILSVGSGLTDPRDWVPLYDSLFEAYTLQNFWGRVWHQLLRWQGTSHGKFLAYRILRLKKGSQASFLVQLYAGFAVSGLIHVSGEYALMGRFAFGHALRFYLMQAVGVTLENIIVKLAKRFSIGGPWRWLGYAWVVTWFAYTVPPWVEPMLRGGLVEEEYSNLGIFDRLLQHA